MTTMLNAVEKPSKQSEDALPVPDNLAQDLIQRAEIGIYIVQDGKVQYSNATFQQLTGYSEKELIGINSINQIHPEDKERVRKKAIENLKGICNLPYEYRFIKKNGDIISVLESVIPTTYQGKRAAVGSFMDITDHKQSREKIQQLNKELEQRVRELDELTLQLQAANKELEAFSYSVSHDLRTPLRSMDGFSQALLEDYGDQLDESGKDYLQRIRHAAQHMAQLIDDMLTLSRVTRSDMHIEKVDLSAMVRSITAELQQNQPERQVEFVITDGAVANGDARLLHAVFQNLLDNAWKFTRTRPCARIEFGYTRNNGKSTYFVRDNGVGFDMAYVDKLFGAFQRLHSPAEFEGTGIGLATIKRIIHRHGGQVWAEAAVDQGATFEFTLS